MWDWSQTAVTFDDGSYLFDGTTPPVGISGSGAPTESPDIVAGSDALSTGGAAVVSEGQDLAAGAGGLAAPGAAAVGEHSDQADGAGALSAAGNGATTEAHDVPAGEGFAGGAGAGAAAENPDIVTGAGVLRTGGSGALEEQPDIAGGTGVLEVAGDGIIVEGDDVVAGTGGLTIGGSGAANERSDQGSGSGYAGPAAIFPYPIQAVTARQQIRVAVLEALQGAELTVGTANVTVDSPGVWPYPQGKLPAACVRSATESKTSFGRGSSNFTTTVEVDVRAAVCATTAEAAQDAIELLWYEIEQAIFQDFYILEITQNVASAESAMDIDAKGQLFIAGMIGRFRFETVDSFDVTVTPSPVMPRSVASEIVPLTEVTIDVTRPGSDPPYSAQQGDVGLTIALPED